MPCKKHEVACLQKYRTKLANTTHGMTKTLLYSKWQSMQRRCYKTYDKDYSKYGGRGIKIAWNTFEEFKSDMHPSYLAHVKKYGSSNTTIDRINNDGDYSKINCRWATVSQQNRNRKCSLILKFKGKSKSPKDWAKYLGINEYTIKTRMLKGWPTSMVLSTTKFSTGPKGVYEKNQC